MELYSYFRSSASFRVRIALHLKGLSFDTIPVHLVKNEQLAASFRALNPEALVPVLEDSGAVMTQSLAICEYLEETHPTPPLLPADALGRSRVRALALLIACEIHPLNNLRVLRYLTGDLGVSEESKDRWYKHWVETGIAAFEAELDHPSYQGTYCHGGAPTLADICLVPQIFNALRFNCDLGHAPRAMRAYEACMALDAFQRAAPGVQPDAF